MVKFTTADLCLLECLLTMIANDEKLLLSFKNIFSNVESITLEEKNLYIQLVKIAKKVEFYKIKSLAE
jgi:hypothetical protein